MNLMPRNTLLYRVIFNRIRDRILLRARLVLTSATPMPTQYMEFLKVCLNASVIQIFGLTEVRKEDVLLEKRS